VSDQVSHPYKTTGIVIVVYILIVIFLDGELEDYCHRVSTQLQLTDISYTIYHIPYIIYHKKILRCSCACCSAESQQKRQLSPLHTRSLQSLGDGLKAVSLLAAQNWAMVKCCR
jgi:hypothetical protein